MQPAFCLAPVLVCTIAASAPATDIVEDFESHALGAFPGAPWHDTAERIDAPTSPYPPAIVVDTTDADGAPTRAVQLVESLGSSAGLWAPIAPAPRHRFSGAVRIDQFCDDSSVITWPVAAGFLRDGPAADLNGNPQLLVYASTFDYRWRIFLKNAANQDWALNSPPVVLGHWYRIDLEVDVRTGAFDARVTDLTTGAQVGQRTVTGVTPWDPELGRFDAIAMFDGDYGADGAAFSRAAYDDIEVHPVAVCPDVTGDGEVDVSDILILLNHWGPCPACSADVNADGQVDTLDLLAVLAGWGDC